MAESMHLCIGHWIIDDLHARINGVGRYAPASLASGILTDGRTDSTNSVLREDLVL